MLFDYGLDWAQMLVRWLHLITGIAWIGASFYFVWLDNHLEPAKGGNPRVFGELWSVHGGGFYHNQKYLLGPEKLPETLHWFKWEAYFTWISGMAMLALLYWANAASFMIDPAVADLTPGRAVLIGAGFLVAGFVVYEALCRSPLVRHGLAFAGVGLALLALAAWGLSQLLSGRAAFIHLGAMIGTVMVANVLVVIIPGQRRIVEAIRAGRTPDPEPGLRGKQRSMHNNYLTLPVLLIMISNHYPMTYSGQWNWAVIIALTIAGMLIRHFFNLRHKGKNQPLYPLAGAAILAGVALALAPRDPGPSALELAIPAERVTFANVQTVLEERCVACHTGDAAPLGIRLDAADQVRRWPRRIHEQVVIRRTMPQGNATGITEEERALIAAWIRAGAKTE